MRYSVCMRPLLAFAFSRRSKHTEAFPRLVKEYNRRVQASQTGADASQQAALQALAALQEYASASCMNASFSPSRGWYQGVSTREAVPSDMQPPAHESDPSLSTFATAMPSSSSAAAREGTTPSASPGNSTTRALPAVCGAFLHGAVGTGKTMCMDVFFQTLTALPEADRQLFHKLPAATPSPAHAADSGAGGPVPELQLQHQVQVHCSKRRLHFHELMLRIHQRLHQLQESQPRVLGRSRHGLPVYRFSQHVVDPLEQVVLELAAGTRVLCVDELHVVDVADAMLLARLLDGILSLGTLVVFTSNRAPADLYKGGMNHKYFAPFISTVARTMPVLKLGIGRDYRLASSADSSTPAVTLAPTPSPTGPFGANNMVPGRGQTGIMLVGVAEEQRLNQLWAACTSRWQAGPLQLSASYGRSLWLPRAAQPPQPSSSGSSSSGSSSSSSPTAADAVAPASRAAFFTFDELCGARGLAAPGSSSRAGLGPSDLLEISRAVPLVFLQGVPQFQTSQRDEARRFVTLLDVLYEERCWLACSAPCGPDELFLPLLAQAMQYGVNPSLGRSAPIDRATLEQHLERTGPPPPTHTRSDADEVSVRALPLTKPILQEEVLMYHRASSRLRELCAVQKESQQDQ